MGNSSGCDDHDYDCSKLTTEDKALMNDSIISQTQEQKKTFEIIAAKSFSPNANAEAVNVIINNINEKAKEQYCIKK